MKLAKRLMMRSGGAWNLLAISPAAWWEPMDSASIVLDGSAISQIADKSGNSRHATMTGSSRPTLSNGMAVFDGADDYMDISVPQASPSHVFAVVDTTALGTGLRMFLDRIIGGSPYPPALYLGTSTQTRCPSIYWGTTVVISDSAARQQFMLLEFRIGPSSVGVRVNGGVEKTKVTSLSVVSTWRTLNAPNTYSQQAAFSLAAEVVVNQALSDVDRQRVEGFLAHRVNALLGIQTIINALPAGHPYKTIAP